MEHGEGHDTESAALRCYYDWALKHLTTHRWENAQPCVECGAPTEVELYAKHIGYVRLCAEHRTAEYFQQHVRCPQPGFNYVSSM